MKSFKLAFSKAETLRRTAATSKYARQIFQAMRPIFADLVQELQRSIGFYSSTHRDANVEKVVALGNAFLLPGLQKYLQQNLGLTVDKPETFQRAIPSAASGNETFKEQFLSFGAAYGLARFRDSDSPRSPATFCPRRSPSRSSGERNVRRLQRRRRAWFSPEG